MNKNMLIMDCGILAVSCIIAVGIVKTADSNNETKEAPTYQEKLFNAYNDEYDSFIKKEKIVSKIQSKPKKPKKILDFSKHYSEYKKCVTILNSEACYKALEIEQLKACFSYVNNDAGMLTEFKYSISRDQYKKCISTFPREFCYKAAEADSPETQACLRLLEE